MKRKITKRVRESIYRISFLNPVTGKYKEPKRKFETYRVVSGRRQSKCFSSVEECEQWRSAKEIVPNSQMLFRDLEAEFFKFGLLGATETTKETRLSQARHLRFFHDMTVESISDHTVSRWIGHIKSHEYLLGQHATRVSYEMELRLLGQILRWYKRSFDKAGSFHIPISKDHRRGVWVRANEEKPVKDLSLAELHRFLAHLDDITAETKWDCVPAIARAQYMLYARVQEAVALHYEDVSPGSVRLNKRVLYRRTKGATSEIVYGLKASRPGKADPGKVIHSAQAARVLLTWAMKKGIRGGPLFFVDAKVVPYRMIQHFYDKAFKLAGIEQTGTHVLRHASLSEFQATCRDLQQTMTVAGHSNIKQTMRYAKVRDQAIEETQNQMEAKLGSTLGLSIAFDRPAETEAN